MSPSLARLCVLPAAIAALFACRGDCTPCQEALDHMAANIEGQACNPNFMETAVSRIEDACAKGHPDWEQYVSQMVDQCQAFLRVETDCSVGPGHMHGWPLELLFVGQSPTEYEVVISDSEGAVVFTGPFEDESYTAPVEQTLFGGPWTVTVQNPDNANLFSESVEVQPVLGGRDTWSPYFARGVEIGGSPFLEPVGF